MIKNRAADTHTDSGQAHDAMLLKAFSCVTHDLRTPLACIIGSLGVLDQMSASLSTEQRSTLVKTALSEAHRLEIFVAEMLDKVKPE